ncbi:MAG: AraC family transcriptional regulator [Proteobacteria bacterium]|nr:AraC family transcriptional regulator [Pseudomonadota bacterium]
MSTPSQWPLPPLGSRIVTPTFMVERLQQHVLSRELYPTALGFYPNARGHRMKRTDHDDYLLIFCSDGRGKLTVGANSHAIEAGDVILLPQSVAHSYRANERDPWSIYWIHYLGQQAADYTDYLAAPETGYCVFSVGTHPHFRTAFQSLLEVTKTGYDTATFLTVSNRLKLLLVELGQDKRQARRHKGLDLTATQTLMREHLHSHISLADLAQAAYLSKYHFSARYKSLTGYAPIQHFLNMKMEYACELLDSTTLSVKAIASELGYRDPLYFSRLFKRTIGVPPTQYRHSAIPLLER